MDMEVRSTSDDYSLGRGLVSWKAYRWKVWDNPTYCWWVMPPYLQVAWHFARDVHRWLVWEVIEQLHIALTCWNVIDWPLNSSVRLCRAVFTCFSHAFYTKWRKQRIECVCGRWFFLFIVTSIASLRATVFASGYGILLRRRQGDRNFWLATYHCLESESLKRGDNRLKVVPS